MKKTYFIIFHTFHHDKNDGGGGGGGGDAKQAGKKELEMNPCSTYNTAHNDGSISLADRV